MRGALQGHIPLQMMIKALYEGYAELKAGSSLQPLKARMAAQAVVEAILRAGDYDRWRRPYLGKN
ncbi:MAG: hypothetical protein ACREQW_20600 [Candidatus Binatia bacterium]